MNDSSLPQETRTALALSVTGLTKHYDSGFTLDDVTFDLPSGYIMGLVGPNGAGKSTLIKLILNMTTRDAGRIEVLGLDAMADEERAKEQLGVVLDSSYFIEYMTVARWNGQAAQCTRCGTTICSTHISDGSDSDGTRRSRICRAACR